MPLIEDYALLGDLQTAALVSRDGSIDWCCFPRFDSPACFAAILGGPEHGRWLLGPKQKTSQTERRYRVDTLILETTHETETGTVRVIDFMPPRGEAPDIVRIVEGVAGEVMMRSELEIRFDYGSVVPWVRRIDHVLEAIAGPDALHLSTPVESHGEGFATVSEFSVRAGDRVPFVLTWFPSHKPQPAAVDPDIALAETEQFWHEWMGDCRYEERYAEEVRKSLIVLKSLTYRPTGGIVAAPTTSLPEDIGGVRNWDYRYCWLRDASLTLRAMLGAGYQEEATSWQDWLLRAIAGDPAQIQIMYGLAGERRLEEYELDWLPGFEGSQPVRVGNGASKQLQLDVYGELMLAALAGLQHGIPMSRFGWSLISHLLDFLERGWRLKDAGIWEVRGPNRHFTHSKVMAWAAFDCAIEMYRLAGRDGPIERWREICEEIKEQVLERAWCEEKQAFAQAYGIDLLDASVLMMPIVGFLSADDPRMVSTVAAIERELGVDGLLLRYEENPEVDGLPTGESPFLACSFWLVEVMAMQGREQEAHALFQRLVGLGNDVGLIAEEYDPIAGRQLGNFPQAFTHLALIEAAFVLNGGRSNPGNEPGR